jgi:hypothetical protein
METDGSNARWVCGEMVGAKKLEGGWNKLLLPESDER